MASVATFDLHRERYRYRDKLRSDNPRRNGNGPRVYAEMFIDPIKRAGVLPLVKKTGLCSRTLYRITRGEQITICEETAERLCIALGIDFLALRYVRKKTNA